MTTSDLNSSDRQRMLGYGARMQFVRHLASLIRANLAAGVPRSDLPRIVETVKRNQPGWFK